MRRLSGAAGTGRQAKAGPTLRMLALPPLHEDSAIFAEILEWDSPGGAFTQ
jgi:hypothetical protein